LSAGWLGRGKGKKRQSSEVWQGFGALALSMLLISLNFYHISGLGTLVSLDYFKLDLLIFLQ